MWALQGNCKVIELVARELQCHGQAQNLLRYETYFREVVVPNVSQLVQLGGQAPASWTELRHWLSAAYRQAMGIELCRARPLTEETFAFFAACPAWGAPEELRVPAVNGFQVLPQAFASFRAWLEPLLQALRRSGLWGRPHCIHGFTSRQAAAALLANSEVVMRECSVLLLSLSSLVQVPSATSIFIILMTASCSLFAFREHF